MQNPECRARSRSGTSLVLRGRGRPGYRARSGTHCKSLYNVEVKAVSIIINTHLTLIKGLKASSCLILDGTAGLSCSRLACKEFHTEWFMKTLVIHYVYIHTHDCIVLPWPIPLRLQWPCLMAPLAGHISHSSLCTRDHRIRAGEMEGEREKKGKSQDLNDVIPSVPLYMSLTTHNV